LGFPPDVVVEVKSECVERMHPKVLLSHASEDKERFVLRFAKARRAEGLDAVVGGVHPVRSEWLNELFTIGVPFARAINPITKTNWEGQASRPTSRCPPPKRWPSPRAHRCGTSAL
jgi:hypothetical protein